MEKYYVQATCKDWKSRESQNPSRYSTLLYLGELPNEDLIRTFIHQAVGDGFGNLCHKFTYPEYRTFITVDVEQEGKTYRWADMLTPRSENSYTESRSITDIDFEVFTVSSGKADSLLDVEEISAKLLDEARGLQTTPMICHSTGLAFDYICVATFVHHVIGKVKDYADRWTEQNSRKSFGSNLQSRGDFGKNKKYYATICEFYLKHSISDYLGNDPTAVVDGADFCIDENGDKYRIFHQYKYREYNLIASIGELSDDAVQLFQKEICRSGIFPYFDQKKCVTVSPRIVCCSVGDKPQWNGNGSIQFPYKRVVPHSQDGVRFDHVKYQTIAIWLREYKQPSLEKQLDLDRKLMYGDSLLQHPEIKPECAFETFGCQILGTCLRVASEIRKSESTILASIGQASPPQTLKERIFAAADKANKKHDNDELKESLEQMQSIQIRPFMENYKAPEYTVSCPAMKVPFKSTGSVMGEVLDFIKQQTKTQPADNATAQEALAITSGVPQEQKPKCHGQKKKQLPSLDEVIETLPPLPVFEQENEHWVLAQTAANLTGVQLRSLNAMRSNLNAEKYGLFGCDSSGRIFWKPEESSKKIFYCVGYLKIKQLLNH